MKKFIPDFLTSMNLFSGCMALVFITNDNLPGASLMIFVAMIFDFFDGFAARMLKVSSGIGKELDSLADVVSFGVVPGMILHELMTQSLQNSMTDYNFFFALFMSFLPFLVPVFSAIRLAKFNNDERQTNSFIGLPTPACALVVASLPMILIYDHSIISAVIRQPVIIAAGSCVLSYLLVSPFRMMSLKFQNFSFAENKMKYMLLALSVVLIALFHFTALPFVVFLYIVLSIAENVIKVNNNTEQSNPQ